MWYSYEGTRLILLETVSTITIEAKTASCGILKCCSFTNIKCQHPRKENSIFMEGTGDEMAEHQKRPQCLVGDCECPTDMAVLNRCPANNDVCPEAEDKCSVRDE